MKKKPLVLLCLFAFLALCETVSAGSTLFFSGNGTTLGGTGNWDTTTANRWGSAAGGPFTLTWNNANGDTAVLAGTPGTVTATSATAAALICTNSTSAAWTFATSGTLTFSGSTPTVFVDGALNNNNTTNNVSFSKTSIMCTGTLTKTGGGILGMNNTTGSISRLAINGGGVTSSANANGIWAGLFGTATVAQLDTNNITLNGGGIAFTTSASQSSRTIPANRGIYLGVNGGWFADNQASAVVVLNTPITGPGDLIFPGATEWPGQGIAGGGIFSIASAANDYQGQTRVSCGEVRLGIDQALPATTTVNVTNSIGLAGTGKFNLFGFTNRVTKLLLDSTGASSVIDSGGTGVSLGLYANEFELRASTAAPAVSATLAGSGTLRKTTSGTISISSTNTYTGDTSIEGGTLILTNNGTISGSFSNSANITIYAGAVLKVTNRLDGTLTVESAQNLSGSGAVHGPVVLKGNVKPGTNGYVGTLNVVGNTTWNGGSKYTWDVNQASGTAGGDPGWDQLNITGGLTIAATSGSPMTIYVTSRTLADAAGSVSDFNNGTQYSWSIAKTTTGITGFDTNAFVINTSGFSNPLDPTGVFRVTTNATDVLLVYALRTTQTITFNPLSNQNYGSTFNPGATTSSGLPVTYSIVSGPATVSGNNVTVTGIGSITVRASQAGNTTYAPATSVDQTFSGVAAPLTVSAAAASRAYGSSNPSFTATYTGFQLGETLGTSDVSGAPSLGTAATSSTVPGNYPITVSAGNLSSSHYALSYSPGTLTITQAVLTVTADNQTRSYNTANPTFTYTITGYVLGENSSVVSGTPTLNTTATISSNPGQYLITVTQNTLSAANYTFAFVNGTLTVQGFPLTVTVVNTNRVYGDTNPAFSVTYSGFVDSDDASVVSGSPVFTTTATNTSTVSGSPYVVSASIGTLTASRYSFTTFVDGQLTITKRPLTVTANNASRAYGAADPSFSASYSGFVNSDTSAVVQGAPQFSNTATPTSTVAGGPYAITPSLGTLSASNYSFGTFVNGQLSITPAPLSVTADNKVRVVGTANPTFTGVISGSLNGDNFSATYSTSADVNSPVGGYAIVPALVDPDSKAGNYNVALNNGTLTVTNDPAIVGQPTGTTNIAGTTATFTVTAITATSVQYQWQKAGVNIANGTDSVLTLPNVSQADAVSYSVIVSNQTGTVTSSSAKLTVIDPINITSGPANVTVPYNTPATFTVQVTGTSPKYQWRKDGINLVNGGNIAGATTATLSLTNATSADLGSYSVVVTNLAGAVTSGTATLTLLDPGFVSQPVSRTNNVGDNAQFSVSAGGATTLTYQWRFNGTNITDATNSVLNVAVTGSGNAGSYSVVVTDSNASITSSDATLSVFFANRTRISQFNFNSTSPDGNVTTGVTTPSINTTLGTPSQALIGTATANGFNSGSSSDPNTTDNSSRRWNGFPATAANKSTGIRWAVNTVGYKNIAFTCELWVTTRSSAYWRGQYSVDNGTNWVDRAVINRLSNGGFVYFADDLTSVAGAANNTNLLYQIVAEYEFTATGSGTNAYVPVDPTSTFNPTSSLFGMDLPTFLAEVFSPPILQSSPTDQTKTAGDTAVFTASSTGTNLAIVWKKNGDNFAAGSSSTVGAVTTSTLTITNVHMSDAGSYAAFFTNVDGATNSTSAVLSVLPTTLSITSDSTSKTYGDANPTFTGSTSGLLPGDSINISYATVADATSPVGGYDITQSIDDPSSILSNYIITTNNGSLTINQAGLSVTADNKLKATGASNPALTGSVVGRKNGDNITGNFVTAATDSSPAGAYTITAGINDPDSKAGNYNIAYHDGTLTVMDVPAITQQPADLSTDAGENAEFDVVATGESLTYQWYHGDTALTNSDVVSGALNSNLTVSAVSLADGGSYYVVISNPVGSITSSNAVLTVQSAPAILGQPASVTANAGTTATFTVAANGAAPLAYIWSLNGAPLSDGANISGSTNATLSVANLQRTSGGSYSVVVSNSFGSVTSGTATLAVVDPAILSNPASATIDGAQTYVLSVTAGGTPTLKYQWYQSNTVTHAVAKLTGKTTSSLTIGPATAATAGGYYCVVNNQLTAPNSATSAVAVVVVNTEAELIINTDHGTGTGTTAHVGAKTFGTVANHAILQIGHTYSVKAIADNGCIFSNWTDGNGTVLTSGSTLKNFVMHSNLVLNANFMTNSVIAGNVAGKFNGLFYETVNSQPDIRVASAGLLNGLTVKSKPQTGPGSVTVGYGPVSGSLFIDGAARPVSGIFDLNGDLKKSVKLDQMVVTRSTLGKPDLLLNLHLDWSGTGKITGTISNMTEGGWVADLSADLAASGSLNKYTMVIDHTNNTTDFPGGYGYGKVSGKSSGLLTFSGKVADGQTYSQSIAPDVHGKVPLYSKLYNGTGLLIGLLDVSGGAPSGNVTWIKPAGWSSPKNINYLNGFTNTLAVSGSLYNSPATGTRILTSDSNNYVVTATDIGSGTDSTLTWNVNLSTANKFIILPGSATNLLSLTVTAGTGEISMKFRPTGAGAGSDKTVAGIVMQGTTNMFGAFQNTGTIGGVTVLPTP